MGQQYSNSPRAKDFLPLVLTILKSSTRRNKFKAVLALEWHYEKVDLHFQTCEIKVCGVVLYLCCFRYFRYFPLDAGWNVATPSCTILKLIFWKIPDRIIVSQTWDKNQVWISLQEFNFDVKRCNLKWLTFKLHVSSISFQCKVNFFISAEQHRSNVLEPKQSLPRPWQLHWTCAK